MKRGIIVVACMVALLGSRETATAGYISAGTIDLYGTGLDSNLNFNSSLGNVHLDFQGGLTLFDGATQTSYGSGNPILGVSGAAAYTSTASLKAFDGQLG